MTTPRRSRPLPAPIAVLAAMLAVVLVACGGEDAGSEEELTPAPNVSPADEPEGPTPQATGMGAGDVELDLTALASGDVVDAAAGGPLDVQACLGGQCSDFQVDPATAGQETLSLDTAGLAEGAEAPVTVRVTSADGTVLAQQEETLTIGEGETSVVVEPLDGGGG